MHRVTPSQVVWRASQSCDRYVTSSCNHYIGLVSITGCFVFGVTNEVRLSEPDKVVRDWRATDARQLPSHAYVVTVDARSGCRRLIRDLRSQDCDCLREITKSHRVARLDLEAVDRAFNQLHRGSVGIGHYAGVNLNPGVSALIKIDCVIDQRSTTIRRSILPGEGDLGR
jgi:hypothetical protein